MSQRIQPLLTLMAYLRDPEFGCPWDRKQTIQSLAAYTLEEAYEVVDAIAESDICHLKEELGDLLFQIVFYAQIAKESQAFCFDDVVDGIVTKMLRRHPHVFPDGSLESFGEPSSLSEQDISLAWQQIKQQEKADKKPLTSLLDEVPNSMPGLMQAVKLQKKAAKVGFDWSELGPVFAKIREELDELEEAFLQGDALNTEAEMGDLLFAVTNLSRHLNVSPDIAISKTNAKFRRRFGRVEELVLSSGQCFEDMSLEELDHYWEQAKTEGL
ncbi:nucleoside triphosphate pyrophosphohydrolase [Marinomonas epiphytica]